MKNFTRAPEYTWHDARTSAGAYIRSQPWITTTTTTTPIYQEEWSIMSKDDNKSKVVYTYLVQRENSTPFSLESIRIELLSEIVLQKGELLSILVQMVSDGVLTFDRKTALFSLDQ